MTPRRPLSVLLALSLLLPAMVSSAEPEISGRNVDQYFIVLAATKNREEALLAGRGWVLETSAYTKLGKGWFANVVGPFRTRVRANEELASLRALGGFANAYVKNAGVLDIPLYAAFNEPKMPPALLAALLGSLDVEVERHPGGKNPCEPTEPYLTLRVRQAEGTRGYDAAADQVRVKSAMKNTTVGRGFTMIERTGEVREMRVCLE